MTQRRGFTMIEILVAIGVIVILAGMLFLGGRAIVNSNKQTATGPPAICTTRVCAADCLVACSSR